MRCIRRSQVSGLVVARGILLRLPRYLLIAFFCFVPLFAITACSYDNNKSTAAPPPPAGAAKQEVIAPIPTAMDTFRALAPPDGLKFTPLFNENITDTNARIKRLEDAVQTIRNDIDTLVPTMVRMVAIEKDIKGLVAQLQTLTDQNQQGQNQQVQPAFVPTGTPSKLPPPLPKQSGSGTPIPGEDVAQGTEPAKADEAKAGPVASSLLVTPEAASKGELPPKDAASPNSGATAPNPTSPATTGGKPIPGEGVAQGTEPAKADEAKAGPVASSLLVTPEAASKGELPPEDAASPNSNALTGIKLKGLDLTPKAAAAGKVVNMRILDTPGKTQLTLDVTAAAPAKMTLINKGKTLVIDLSKFKWLGSKEWEADHKQLISGGYVKGGKLYVDLKRASEFKAEKILAPSDDEKNYRLIIDLFNKRVQKAAASKAIAPAAPAPQPTPAPVPAAVPAPASKATGDDFP